MKAAYKLRMLSPNALEHTVLYILFLVSCRKKGVSITPRGKLFHTVKAI